jgi:large subunit ribosomal protein L1
MEQELFNKFNAFIEENKNKRKFTQSVELAINFRGIDFSKPDKRLNLEVALPSGKGRESKIMAFSNDSNLSQKASKLGVKTVSGNELNDIATDKAKLNELLDYELVAQPNLMPLIARALGQFLGPKGKMPRPLVGDVESTITTITKSIYIRSKGKYLPTVHCVVGTEKMPAQALAANIDEVISAVSKKIGRQNIRSVYAKLTMSKPMRIV